MQLNLYRKTFYFSSETARLVFIIGSVTLLALACAWLFRIPAHKTFASSHATLNLIPLFLLIGLMYIAVLRQRKQFFSSVPALTIVLIMFVFACLFVVVVLSI
jgi:hypothetical protein